MPNQPARAVAHNVRWAPPITFVLSLAGLGASIYLTYTHFHPAALICHASSHINCAEVTTSSQSEIFNHIPVAIAGLAFYAGMVVLMSPWVWRIADPRIGWLRLAAVVTGIGMVGYLVYVEAVQIKAICLWCTGVHIVTFLLFFTVLAAYLLRPLDPT
jgi:uncharacterized membrane protein